MAGLKYWVWLNECRGLTNRSRALLLAHFGSPEDVYYADEAEYALVEGLSKKQFELLADKSTDGADKILGDCQRRGLRILTMQDADYPARLRGIFEPPCLLYVTGTLPAFDEEVAVAMVGTRACTPYGTQSAEKIAYGLAKQGALVVSGAARGIDSAAHRGALRAGGVTVAVLGNGLDVVYPEENAGLYRDIAATGALLSEYPPGTAAEGWHFPIRNRIISGLCLATVVVEAPLERSGALVIRCQNGLLQRLASGGAHLVHGGEAHAAALIERHIKARGLKGRGAHAPDVLNQIGCLDGAGLGGLDGEARGGGGERGVVTAGECDSKRLAQARHDGHINSSAAQHIALERGAGGVDGTLAANHAHAATLGHAAGHAALDDVAGGGIIGGDGGQELVKLVIVAKLQQVALAHGLKQLNAGDGSAPTAVVGLEAAHIAVGRAAAQHRAHDLAAVVGALVAHHLVTRGTVLVGVRKVTVKAALELALAGGFLVLGNGGSG